MTRGWDVKQNAARLGMGWGEGAPPGKKVFHIIFIIK